MAKGSLYDGNISKSPWFSGGKLVKCKINLLYPTLSRFKTKHARQT